jgi:hypothetical protein
MYSVFRIQGLFERKTRFVSESVCACREWRSQSTVRNIARELGGQAFQVKKRQALDVKPT